MKNWKAVLIAPTVPIIEAVRIIESEALQIALVTDENSRLLGTVTDGDIRRALLQGLSLQTPVSRIMCASPTTATPDDGDDAILATMRRLQLGQIPVLDAQGRVVEMKVLKALLSPGTRDNWAVILAGGLGTRLRPLTENCPKPMLRVGGRPVLETIIHRLRAAGFRRFFLSINYLAELIESHFGSGEKLGVEITYLREPDRLGTAGPLSLLPERPTAPVLVMNGDILTKVNFEHILDFHAERSSMATMCVREYHLQVPYGVVRLEGDKLSSIDEKPVHRFFVNAGIYALEPDAIAYVPRGEHYDMPRLFQTLVDRGHNVSAFPIHEYWLDIGQIPDLEKAHGEFTDNFGD